MEMILTHITTHYEDYEDFVSHNFFIVIGGMSLIVILKDAESSTVLQHILKSPTRCNDSVASQVLNLLFKALNKRYPSVKDITEDILMEWSMWPCFLGMTGRYIHITT